jgi:hypothetical protein
MKALRKIRRCLKEAHHLGFADAHHSNVGYRSCCRQTQGLGKQTALAKKVSLTKQGYDRFFPLLGGHGDFDFSLQYIEDGVGCVSL